MPVGVTDQSVADEAVTLTGRGHLLDRMDFDDLVLQGAGLTSGGREEVVDDLVLTDGKGMEVDILQFLDLACCLIGLERWVGVMDTTLSF